MLLLRLINTKVLTVPRRNSNYRKVRFKLDTAGRRRQFCDCRDGSLYRAVLVATSIYAQRNILIYISRTRRRTYTLLNPAFFLSTRVPRVARVFQREHYVLLRITFTGYVADRGAISLYFARVCRSSRTTFLFTFTAVTLNRSPTFLHRILEIQRLVHTLSRTSDSCNYSVRTNVFDVSNYKSLSYMLYDAGET